MTIAILAHHAENCHDAIAFVALDLHVLVFTDVGHGLDLLDPCLSSHSDELVVELLALQLVHLTADIGDLGIIVCHR